MARNQRNLKPDIILKNYWRDNARFADLFNAVLFQGEQVIQPHELEDLDTESSTILEHKKQAEGIAAAKARGVRFGRERLAPPPGFRKMARLWREGSISASAAAEKLDMSRDTFLRRAREYDSDI